MTLEERMIDCGFNPQPLPASGQIKRFDVQEKKKGNGAGWIMGIDHQTAAFGSWVDGSKFIWSANFGRKLTAQEKQQAKSLMEKAMAEHKVKKESEQKIAANKANHIYNTANEVISHRYLANKNIVLGGIKESKGNLVVPIVNENVDITSIQFISPDGQKKFLPNGRIKGCFFPLSIGDKPITVIAEGVATAASLAEFYYPNCNVIAAFNAGNLKAVARLWKEKMPSNQIIIAGDNDIHSTHNVGKQKAIEAANAVGGIIDLPEFMDGETGTDWNDRAAIDFAHIFDVEVA